MKVLFENMPTFGTTYTTDILGILSAKGALNMSTKLTEFSKQKYTPVSFTKPIFHI